MLLKHNKKLNKDKKQLAFCSLRSLILTNNFLPVNWALCVFEAWMQFILIILNLIFGLGVIAWPLGAFSSIFFFDAPGSTSNILVIGLAISVLGYPVPAILGNLAFWANRKKESVINLTKMTLLSSSGYLSVLIFWFLLGSICNGKLAC